MGLCAVGGGDRWTGAAGPPVESPAARSAGRCRCARPPRGMRCPGGDAAVGRCPVGTGRDAVGGRQPAGGTRRGSTPRCWGPPRRPSHRCFRVAHWLAWSGSGQRLGSRRWRAARRLRRWRRCRGPTAGSAALLGLGCLRRALQASGGWERSPMVASQATPGAGCGGGDRSAAFVVGPGDGRRADGCWWPAT